jgi:hypothetical protein
LALRGSRNPSPTPPLAAPAPRSPTAAVVAIEEAVPVDSSTLPWYKKALRATKEAALYGTSVDIHKVVEEDELVAAMHANAEVFDPKTELVFGYLQVFSAIAVIFGEAPPGARPRGAALHFPRRRRPPCAAASHSLARPSPLGPSLFPQPTAPARWASWLAPCLPSTTSTATASS